MKIAITFRGHPYYLPNGVSPGGAVFPYSVISFIDHGTHTIRLRATQRVEIKRGLVSIDFKECKIRVHPRLIKKIQVSSSD